MINNNKILTVSYGTFSCTLEGFDDSFGTMKAIAEYFRGLASEDRYFGAEPPQPDAEMLARIAQKEISRRVEAREHEGKIVLSAMEDDAAVPDAAASQALTADAAPTDAPVLEATSEAAPIAQTAVATGAIIAAQQAVTTQGDTSEMSQDDGADDTIADETTPDVADHVTPQEHAATDEIKDDGALVDVASAAETAPEEPVHITAPLEIVDDAPADIAVSYNADDVAAEDQQDVAQTPDTEADAILAEADVETHAERDGDVDIVPGQPDAAVEAFFENAATADDISAEDTIAPIAEPSVAPEPAPAADSIAAKLQRIRAVVAQHDDDAEEDDYSEDEHASDQEVAQIVDMPTDAEVADTALSDARRDIEDALEADESAAESSEEFDEDASDDDVDEIASILNRMAAEDTPAEDSAANQDDMLTQHDVPEHDTAPTAEGNDDALENLFNEGVASSAEDQIAGIEEDTTNEPETPTLTETAQLVASQELRLEPQPAEPATAKLPRARVIKVKRADLEAAIQSGELEEYEDEDDNTPLGLDDLAPARTTESSLSPEDQDDLARELAELEADIEMEHAPIAVAEDVVDDIVEDAAFDDAPNDDIILAATDVDTDVDADIEAQAQSARAKLPNIDEEGQSEDMARLLAETDHQMDEPESATRRDAFAHLRAAVAAKKADEALGRNDDTVQGDDAYRSDLADVVRPRRPVSGEGRTKRPGEARPAPLKLVAEQRIDAAQPAAMSSMPVRPRRVAATPEAVPAEIEGDSFADYAAEKGATKLPELLEAAASYMSFVEGRDQFSRPQLMTKVRQAGPDGFSREDTLRSFGKLLRDGKIEKIKAGRFAASEDIGFRPDQRAAG